MASPEFLALPDIVRRDRPYELSADASKARTPSGRERRGRSPGKRVFFVDSVLPDPSRDAASVDTINYVSWLRDLGYDVHFLSTSYGREKTPEQPLLSAGGKILRLKTERSVIDFLYSNGIDYDIFFLSRVHSGGLFLEACRQANHRALVIFYTVDLHFIREEREARLLENEVALLRSSKVKERELYLAHQSDLTIVVSSVEKTILEKQAPQTNVAIMPLFRPSQCQHNSFEERSGLGFVGGFAHSPNVDAVKFFLTEVWPLVKQLDTSLTFEIAGTGLPAEIANSLPEGVSYKGHVANLEQWLSKLRLTVAPLRFGAGAKGKVASSIVNGVPVVGTSIAFEGMGLGPKNTVSADTPELFAQEIIRVHNDRETWIALSDEARDFGVAHLSPEVGKKRFSALLDGFEPEITAQKT